MQLVAIYWGIFKTVVGTATEDVKHVEDSVRQLRCQNVVKFNHFVKTLGSLTSALYLTSHRLNFLQRLMTEQQKISIVHYREHANALTDLSRLYPLLAVTSKCNAGFSYMLVHMTKLLIEMSPRE